MARVLLAASFPSGSRGDAVRPYDTRQISDATVYFGRALLRDDHQIVFGAHPTISPLILSIAGEQGVRDRVEIHQPEWFESVIPEDTRRLQGLGYGTIVITPAAETLAASLTRMRNAMCRNIDAAAFIGGMDGLNEEAELVLAAGAPCYAVTAPGGYARTLGDRPGFQTLDGTKYPELAAAFVDEVRRQSSTE